MMQGIQTSRRKSKIICTHRTHHTTHADVLLLITVVLNGVACNPTSDRPPFAPLPRAMVDTVTAEPDAVIRVMAQQFRARGIELATTSEIDGFLETKGYDVAAKEVRSTDLHHPERIVVVRVWADAIPGGRTRITTEATHRQAEDPSVMPRVDEVVIGPDHPGRQMILEVLEAAIGQLRGASGG